MYFRTEGVILKRRNFAEADRILSIYTRDFGKLTVLAKGVRRPKSKKAGHVELGSWCKVFLARGKNLDILTEVEVKKAFGIADFSPTKTNKIYHLLELIELLTEPHQKNRQVFILLIQFLKKLTEDVDFNLLLSVFKVKLLSLLGFFSAKSMKDSKTEAFFRILEDEDFEKIQQKIKLKGRDYLKLLSFLDSMIEEIAEKKLSTSRFVYGQD